MLRYALTIFLSAFLLFQVQPLIGKYILPWFGGTPSVWTTCMLFFQLLLLGGYAYAHLIASKLSTRNQTILHLGLLGASVAFLWQFPPDASWKPADSQSPSLRILLLLGATIGAPYLVLSSTGPLLQQWFHRTNPGRSPYRLYALSNVGSLLALLTYPFLVEPSLKLGMQAMIWSAGYVCFAVLCGWCAVKLMRASRETTAPATTTAGVLTVEPVTSGEVGQQRLSKPSWVDVTMWIALAAAGSAMLLATTNQMSQEVAVVPFLWILPLALYLLTFIICFDSPMWYLRSLFIVALAASTSFTYNVLVEGAGAELWKQVVAFSATMFVSCMVCHGELYKSRPHPRYLTLFYLCISAGGAIGGLLVAIVAPNVFPGYWEYHIVLPAICALALLSFSRDPNWILYRGRPRLVWAVLIATWIGLVVSLVKEAQKQQEDTIYMARNFYGALKVEEHYKDDDAWRFYQLTHGRIMHGIQYRDPEKRYWPTSYYGSVTGIGISIEKHPRRSAENEEDRALRVGVVGLGTGTTAALMQKGDYLRYYEINPQVIRLSDQRLSDSDKFFTYLSDAEKRGASVDVVLGDARVQMERELERGESQQFDVLAVDAFSSDAIPMHLLTRECTEIYWKHLKPDGILALHISNRHMDLAPVCRALAEEFGHTAVRIHSYDVEELGVDSAEWILLTRNEEFLNSGVVQSSESEWDPDSPPPLLWTDDYGSIWQILNKPEFLDEWGEDEEVEEEDEESEEED